MLENRKYIIFVLMLVFIISISAAGESANGNFKSEVKNNIHPKIESGLMEQNQGIGIGSAVLAQSLDQRMKRVVFELKDSDRSHIRSLEESGAVIEAVHDDLVQASVPVSQLEAMSDLPFVNYIRSPRIPFKDVEVISEGVGVINATPIHNLGLRGQGIKIAILDIGFEGYQSKLGTELPDTGNVTAKSFRADEDITGGHQNHGTAVAEIIHDIAPDARLYLINFGSDMDFPGAVDYAVNEKVDIISMSLGWLDGPFDGNSIISAKVNSTVSGGIVWVNSAGNYAQKHWQGKFNDSDSDKIHEFAPDDENMTLNSGGNIELFLSWDDWPASDQDYNMYVYNSTGYLVASSTTVQDGTQPPVERISSSLAPGTYKLQIRKYNATRAVNFELYSAYDVFQSQYQVPSSSLSIPADAQGAITVGATYWSNDLLEPFSSRGPTDDGRTKPDVVAPDSVQTLTLTPFNGTSASAPYVAGAAALLKSINSSLTPALIRYALQSTAKSLGEPNSYGSGRIDVWKAAVMVDKRLPAITIASPVSGKIFNNSNINVTGSASDNIGVNKVEVKVGTGTWQKAAGTNSWSATIILSQEGQNTIYARATDIAGNIQNTSVNVTLDTTLPAISIEFPKDGQNLNKSVIAVTGSASDNLDLSKVEVRVGAGAWQKATGTTSWSANITLSPGLNTISSRATDNAGNIQNTSVNVTSDTTLPTITIEFPKDGQKLNKSVIAVTGSASGNDLSKVEVRVGAGAWQKATGTTSWSATITLSNDLNMISARVSDTTGNINETSMNVSLDTKKPEVTNIKVSTSTPIVNNPVNMEAKVIDDYTEILSSSVVVEAPDGKTSKCPMVDNGKGIYNCNFKNTSSYGRYNIMIIASDVAGNINDTEKTWFVTTTKPENISVNTVKNNITEINALKEVNTTLELVTSLDVTKGVINITMKSDIPPEMNRSMGSLVPFGKYISIEGNNLESLNWMKLNIYYTEKELITSRLDENSLRILYYNESSNRWELLFKGSPSWVYDADVNAANTNNYSGFVWANVSHFSTFALVGSYPVSSTPPLSSNSGGGGGGGGGGTSGENFSNIIVKERYEKFIYKDIVTSYNFSNINNPILSIDIVGNINAGEIGTAVEVLRNTSSLVQIQPPGTVYKNANIWVGTSGFANPKNIKSAVIKFKVPNTWLESNGIASGEMKMVRWDGDKWVTLDTEVMEKDDVNTYFETKTSTFSPFAATGIRSVRSEAFPEQVSSPLNALQPEPTGTTGANAKEVAPPIDFVLIIEVLIIFILIIAVLFIKKDRYLRR